MTSSEKAANRRQFPLRLEVVRTERLTPAMQRVVLGGPSFDEFARRFGGFTDSYVKLLFLREGIDYPEPLDMDLVRATMPVENRPLVRTYTVRWIDHTAAQIAIDFVVHGDEGVAGPWAAAATTGDVIHLLGPGGAFAPDDRADWYLVAGDEAALPAALAALEAVPAGKPAYAFLEVDGVDDEQKVETAADLHLTWLHRAGAPAGSTTAIADAVTALDWPAGQPQVFVHGEAGLLKSLRPYLLVEHGLARDAVSISGYWRRGSNEEGFRAWKAEQRR